MLQKVLDVLPVVAPVMVGVNVILGGVGQILAALHQSKAESVVGKISGGLKKVLDLLTGNIAH